MRVTHIRPDTGERAVLLPEDLLVIENDPLATSLGKLARRGIHFAPVDTDDTIDVSDTDLARVDIHRIIREHGERRAAEHRRRAEQDDHTVTEEDLDRHTRELEKLAADLRAARARHRL